MTNKQLIQEVQNIIKPVVDRVEELEKVKSVSPPVELELTTIVKNKFPTGYFPQQQFVRELKPLMFKYRIIDLKAFFENPINI